jgi:ElaB/YqjD/DUF883 family membrane-anchored ribosome-binding protein
MCSGTIVDVGQSRRSPNANALKTLWFHATSHFGATVEPSSVTGVIHALGPTFQGEATMATTSPGINQGANEARPSAYDTPAHEVKDDVEALRRDIASLACTVSSLATEKFGATVGDVKKGAEQKLSSVEAAIRHNPTQSALIAVGVGFLFGLVVTR